MDEKLNLSLRDLAPYPTHVDIGDGRILVRHDYTINDSHFTGKPSRVAFNLNITNAKDYVALVNEYKEPGTKVFYDNNGLKAVIDHSLKDQPEYHERVIVLKMEKTPEYVKFSSMINRVLTQEEYILFLKELEPYIASDAITLIETAENLRLASDIGSTIEYDKNSRSYSFEIKGAPKSGRLPERFALSLPMYLPIINVNTAFDVVCRYGWSEARGFSVNLLCYGKDRIERNATDLIVKDIVDQLNVPAYRI